VANSTIVSLSPVISSFGHDSLASRPYTVDAPIGGFRFVHGQRSVAFRAQQLAEVQSIRDRERPLSKTDERAMRLASILLRASGATSVRSKIDTMLGAHALMDSIEGLTSSGSVHPRPAQGVPKDCLRYSPGAQILRIETPNYE
jgi:hypothetical protein